MSTRDDAIAEHDLAQETLDTFLARTDMAACTFSAWSSVIILSCFIMARKHMTMIGDRCSNWALNAHDPVIVKACWFNELRLLECASAIGRSYPDVPACSSDEARLVLHTSIF